MNFIVTLVALFSLTAQALDFLKDIEGKDCVLTEPIHNYTFNFTNLRSELGFHLKSEDQPETFLFNVCGKLSRKCNNQTAAACVTDEKGKEIVFGYNDYLFWNDGVIRFSYKGEKCSGTENYLMNVLLHCDYSGSKTDFLGAFHKSGDCSAYVFLRTRLACLETEHVKTPNCMVTSKDGHVYDFSSLKNSNHKAEGHDKILYNIGICNPVLYGHETACGPGTSVCAFNSTETDFSRRYKNVGVMTEDFKIEEDHISLKLTSQEPCSGNKKYSSKIIFECDKLADVSYPTYKATNDCEIIFHWPTTLACKEKKPCQVSSPETTLSFDFSTLAGIKYEAIHQNNSEEKFFFSVCSTPPSNEPCMQNSGSCIWKTRNNQSTQAGVVSDELRLDGKKKPYLKYENGAFCHKTGNKFSTRIHFICADNMKDEGAIVVEDGCEVTIDFKTLLACGNINNCIASSIEGRTIDLSPLIDYEGNYIATVDEKALPQEFAPVTYVLNVCRPLNSKYSLNCRGTSGACRTILQEDGKHEEELSLGHPDYSTMMYKKNDTYEVIMKYFDGSTCPTDKDENVTTSIRFYCDETVGLGSPSLMSIDNCLYSFDFPTNILCNEKFIEVRNGCMLTYDKVSIDLKLFGMDGVYKVGDKKIDICDGAAAKFYTIVYEQSLVRIEFAQTFGKDEIDVEVQLKCSASNQTKVLHDDRILVMHEGVLICPLLKIVPKASAKPAPIDIEPTNAEAEKTTSSGFTWGYVFLILVVIVAFLAFYLVIRNPERREIIGNILRLRSNSSSVQYSRNMNDDDLF